MKPMRVTDKQAEVMRLHDEEGLTLAEIGERLGKSEVAAHSLYRRGKDAIGVARQTVGEQHTATDLVTLYHMERKDRRVTDRTLVASIESILDKILYFLDNSDPNLADVRPKDLVDMASKLIDKYQLLKGEPTAITRVQDIRDMEKLMDALAKEAQRRGRLIDVTPEEVDG